MAEKKPKAQDDPYGRLAAINLGKKYVPKPKAKTEPKVNPYASLIKANMAGVKKPKAKSKADIKAAVVKPKAKPASGAMRSYRASKGDSLYAIAEKTLPKGKNLSSWFGAIKKMNAGKRLYSNTGVALPPGSGQYKQGMPYAKSTRKLNGPR
jgi:hypothetical protein